MTVQTVDVTFETLHDLEGGKYAALLRNHLANLARDCIDRPMDDKERTRPVDTEQRRAITDLHNLRDQIEKQHWLNVHFRAFRLSHDAWQQHILANARLGSRAAHSPAGAVLDEPRGEA